ncbi:hypothetical protein D6777_03640 [Candidatus Woesearchaeota archaeon]|nr:MAG: hypothetical protein D6777_03640 [Candidatus Woesearchaeota archaeon]
MKWEPPKGTVLLDDLKKVHPEKGVYDFARFKRKKLKVKHDNTLNILRNLYQGVYNPIVDAKPKPEPLQKSLKFPEFVGDLKSSQLETIVKGVKTETITSENYPEIVLRLLSVLNPHGSNFIFYHTETVDSSWQNEGWFEYRGFEHKNDEYWFKINTDYLGIGLKKDAEYDFAFDQKYAIYIHSSAGNGYILAKSKRKV